MVLNSILMRYTSQYKQLSLDLFKSSFDDLDKNNRWVILADQMPWAEIERLYNSRLENKYTGAGNKPARMVIGACIIKYKFSLSDEETIEMIRENPYMQYLCGLSEFTDIPIFDPSLFVTIRKRISIEEINGMTTSLLKKEKERKEQLQSSPNNEDNGTPSSQPPSTDEEDSEFTDGNGEKHKGVLKIDATCADAEVRYPVDIDLIHDGCKAVNKYSARICEVLGIKRMKTSYKDVRRWYLELVKRKKKSGKFMRETIACMLSSLQKDLRRITELFIEHKMCRDLLLPHEQRVLTAVFDMYYQQRTMHETGVHTIPNRIISIFQPHIRPIVRGKAKAKVEFGAKIGAAVCEGYTFVDHHSWDAYNESADLKLHIQKYKERFGYLPAVILADKIYMNKENRQYLKELQIKTYCKPLGRPPKQQDPLILAKMAKAVGERNEVECSFGTGKRIYRANNIRAKRPDTARCWTGLCYFVKNVMKFLRGLCLFFGQRLQFLCSIWRISSFHDLYPNCA